MTCRSQACSNPSISQSLHPRKTANRILNLCLTRFLNIRLDSITVLDEARHPHMVSTAQALASPLQPTYCDIRWQSRTVSLEARLYGMSLYPQSTSIRSFWRMQRGEVRDCCPSTIGSYSRYHSTFQKLPIKSSDDDIRAVYICTSREMRRNL